MRRIVSRCCCLGQRRLVEDSWHTLFRDWALGHFSKFSVSLCTSRPVSRSWSLLLFASAPDNPREICAPNLEPRTHGPLVLSSIDFSCPCKNLSQHCRNQFLWPFEHWAPHSLATFFSKDATPSVLTAWMRNMKVQSLWCSGPARGLQLLEQSLLSIRLGGEDCGLKSRRHEQ